MNQIVSDGTVGVMADLQSKLQTLRSDGLVCKIHITEVFIFKALHQIQVGKAANNDADVSDGKGVISKQLATFASGTLGISKQHVSSWLHSQAAKALEEGQ